MDYLQYLENHKHLEQSYLLVLNLIINGLPSIRILIWTQLKESSIVLNLIINGLPSIQLDLDAESVLFLRFKPYYKWITFNTIQLLITY